MVSVNTHKNGINSFWDVRLNSADTKPTEGVPNGSTCIEINTGKGYLYDAEGEEWYEIPEGSSVVIDPARGVSF